MIGDSTFLHSGVTPLMDAVAADTDMTLLILDNETVAMTGQQETILPSTRLETVVRGVGVSIPTTSTSSRLIPDARRSSRR